MVTRTEGKQEALKEHCGHFSQCSAAVFANHHGRRCEESDGGRYVADYFSGSHVAPGVQRKRLKAYYNENHWLKTQEKSS